MNPRDLVLHDLPELYPGLTRPGIEQVLQLMDQAPGETNRLSLSAALKAVVPNISDRLNSLADANATVYLRILKGAAVQVLQMWKPDCAAPKFETIATAVEAMEP